MYRPLNPLVPSGGEWTTARQRVDTGAVTPRDGGGGGGAKKNRLMTTPFYGVGKSTIGAFVEEKYKFEGRQRTKLGDGPQEGAGNESGRRLAAVRYVAC